jgi:hypothetical protein
MGWETRERGGRYYTRSCRIAGSVTREYVGAGEAGKLAEELDAVERQERAQAARERAEIERQQLEVETESDNRFRALARITDLLYRCNLILAGYHQHNRGEWRKRK